ncbi:hypothetical protein [Kutzneria sp. NPDC052558]|uniref:hypothetical protein n=1 Tax=Kutzneria sp. NPDC052558 TaxID=3364121 RepID=UPI0037C98E7E
MKKITVWLTATAAAIALVIGYQLNVAGVGGKEGDGGDPPAAATAPADPSATGTATGTPAPTSTAKSDSDGANTDHTGKPGENK